MKIPILVGFFRFHLPVKIRNIMANNQLPGSWFHLELPELRRRLKLEVLVEIR